MSDALLIQQALSSRLLALEEMRLEYVGESDAPQICAECYMPQDECYCSTPEPWSISAVIYKLRAELALAGGKDGAA